MTAMADEHGALAVLSVPFTALAERFAPVGPVAVAEAIAPLLDSLVEVAAAVGGTLLRCHGDTLWLWFPGDNAADDAARRACQAAARGRAALRRLGPVPTPKGTMRIQVSGGVHAGTFSFFARLGPCGPATSRTVLMAEAATAGRLVVSPEMAAAVGSRWMGPALGPGVTLNTPPPGSVRAQPSPVLRLPQPVAATPTLAEVSVACLRFDGTDAAGDRGHIDELVRVVQAACDDHRVALLGTRAAVDGGRFLLGAHGPDDRDRMLHTLRAIVDARSALPVRAGAHRGVLFAADVGRAHVVVGEAAVFAAGVADHAAPGEILATKAILDSVSSRFATTRRAPAPVGGKGRPLVTHRVGRSLDGGSDGAGEPAFAGRDAELAAIVALAPHTGGFVEVVGPAGSGKTRLLEEACRLIQSQGESVVRLNARTHPYASTTPYAAFRAPMCPCLDATSQPALRRHRPFLAVACGLEGPPPDDVEGVDQPVWRARFHAAMVNALSAVAGRGQTLVLVIDDAEWLDDASIALVRHLAGVAASKGWLVLCARQPDAEVDLAPPGVGRLVELGERPLEPDDELLPRARVEQLAPEHRATLRDLSVLGPHFPVALAAAVLDRPSLEPLREFVAVDGDHARFRRDAVRSNAYAGLSNRRRREMHGRVGDALTIGGGGGGGGGGADLGLMATHFDLAHRFDDAWHHGVLAGERAMAQHAYVEAVALYRLALRAAGRATTPPPDHDLCQAWEALGDALRFTDRLADATAAYQKAQKLVPAGAQATQARLCLAEGNVRGRLGRPTSALRWYARGLRLLGNGVGSPRTRTRLLIAEGRLRHEQGRHQDAWRLLSAAMHESEAAGDRPGLAHACLWLSSAGAALGRPGHEELAERALALYRGLQAVPWEAEALAALAASRRSSGRWEAACASYAQAALLLDSVGDPLGAAIVRYNHGDLLTVQGRATDAIEVLGEARLTLQAAHHEYEPMVAAALARALGLLGSFEEAEALFADAVPRLEAAGLVDLVTKARGHWAETRVAAGHDDAAAAELGAGSNVRVVMSASGGDVCIEQSS
jgi:tetratricopeptide (TPR) repeat protein/energy-coupling factor transporter ATP-binding protein EcfA2